MGDSDDSADLMNQIADGEDDGPPHDPGRGTFVAASTPTEVHAGSSSSSSLQVTATPIAPTMPRTAPIELGGNNKTAVWSVYKNVMATVFSEVRQLVEQEGLEPSVATAIRDVRRGTHSLCAPSQLLVRTVAEMDPTHERIGRLAPRLETCARAPQHFSRQRPAPDRSATPASSRRRDGQRAQATRRSEAPFRRAARQ